MQNNTKMDELLSKSEIVYAESFGKKASFERAIFYSWACQLEECCKYCYMSTIPKEKRTKEKVRSFASLLAETIICKELGWDYGFLAGGVGVFSAERIVELLAKTVSIMDEKVWINIGTMNEDELKLFKPYIKGVIGTIEVLDPKLHKEICPSKPISAVEEMFEAAKKIGIDCGMTLIVGLGETISDFELLERFINKHDIKKIHIYGLNPQKGTEFENCDPPTAEYQAEWIARTRIVFPKIDIQCGIWTDRVDRVGLLLRAGANSVSKFPALKAFATKESNEIEKQAASVGREFSGTLTVLPDVDWDLKVDLLSSDLFSDELKEEMKKKLRIYLNKFEENIKKFNSKVFLF